MSEAAGAALAAPGRKAAVATTALSTVRMLLMRFSAAHSFCEDGHGAPHTSAGGPCGHPCTQPSLV
ncbi:hypothetical protein AMK18_21290 [Streptomyces sp. CB01249]|nr:hypothetical protein AMK18_21290 [Streptomyces sp. CB01249]